MREQAVNEVRHPVRKLKQRPADRNGERQRHKSGVG